MIYFFLLFFFLFFVFLPYQLEKILEMENYFDFYNALIMLCSNLYSSHFFFYFCPIFFYDILSGVPVSLCVILFWDVFYGVWFIVNVSGVLFESILLTGWKTWMIFLFNLKIHCTIFFLLLFLLLNFRCFLFFIFFYGMYVQVHVQHSTAHVMCFYDFFFLLF